LDGRQQSDRRVRPQSNGDRKASERDSGAADVGAALRNAFKAAVDEDVPDELLDLLRRLD